MNLSDKKLAIVGAGNAGCIAALHFKCHAPDLQIDLYHNEENHPIELVGQGTTKPVAQLLSYALDSDWFNNKIGATLKTGILYKNWGTKKAEFFHDFYTMDQVAFHYTPAKLSDCVLSSGFFNVKEQEINDPDNEIDADFIIDCRGRKAVGDKGKVSLSNPINAVLLSSLPKKELIWTEAEATPNGWTFTIPTEDKLSLGYLYNYACTSKEDAMKDFEERFRVEEIEHAMTFQPYSLVSPFYNLTRAISGNQCAFIEPLEATASGLYLYITKLVYDHFINKKRIAECQFQFQIEVKSIEQFILLHYNTGSPFKSRFWDIATKLPYEQLIPPKEGETVGQWGKKSFDIWYNNT